MRKFLLVVAFGSLCGLIGYGYGNGNIHADSKAVSVHTSNMAGVAPVSLSK